MTTKRTAAYLLLLVLPLSASAQIEISEIMYDLEAGDDSREWIEVVNTSQETIDLTTWKFYENDSNHSITIFQGDTTLAPGFYAIIAETPEEFLNDWPNFTGQIFDSSWGSLSNSGESLSLRNPDGDLVSLLTYSSTDGASGNGNTLHVNNGLIIEGIPTPGEGFVEPAHEDPASTAEASSSVTPDSKTPHTETSATISKAKYFSPTLEISGPFFVHFPVTITPHITEYTTPSGVRGIYHWYFGDGSEHTSIYNEPIQHSYEFPGTYTITYEYAHNNWATQPDGILQEKIVITPSKIAIEHDIATGFLTLHNLSRERIHLENWSVENSLFEFSFPKYTYIEPRAVFPLSHNIFRWSSDALYTQPLTLKYPNGQFAFHYEPESITHNQASEDGYTLETSTDTDDQKEVVVGFTQIIEEGNTIPQNDLIEVLVASPTYANTETGSRKKEKEGGITPFIAGLGGVIAIASIAILSAHKKRVYRDENSQLDDIEILGDDN